VQAEAVAGLVCHLAALEARAAADEELGHALERRALF
jgi:hypothetical protein